MGIPARRVVFRAVDQLHHGQGVALNCPWHTMAVSQYPFCEAPLCAWVEQPSNTFSNLGFLAVGIWILARERREQSFWAIALGLILVATAAGSAFYHATGTFLGEA